MHSKFKLVQALVIFVVNATRNADAGTNDLEIASSQELDKASDIPSFRQPRFIFGVCTSISLVFKWKLKASDFQLSIDNKICNQISDNHNGDID